MLAFDTNATFIHFRFCCVLGFSYEECVLVYDPTDANAKGVVDSDAFMTSKLKLAPIQCPKCKQWLEGDVPALMITTMLNRI